MQWDLLALKAENLKVKVFKKKEKTYLYIFLFVEFFPFVVLFQI